MTSTPKRSVPRSNRVRPIPAEVIERRLAQARALQNQIQVLEAQLDIERAWILEHMTTTGADRLTLCPEFYVSMRVRHNWTYSPETARDMLRLRQTQKWEQSEGIASDAPKRYIALINKEAK